MVESLRPTQFEVLGFGLKGQVVGRGLETCKSSKMPCLRLSKTALFFDLLKMGQGHNRFCFSSWNTPETTRNAYETLFLENARIFAKNLRFVCAKTFLVNTCALCPWSLSFPVRGLDGVCPRKVGPWPWPRFFLLLALSLVSSTPPLIFVYQVALANRLRRADLPSCHLPTCLVSTTHRGGFTLSLFVAQRRAGKLPSHCSTFFPVSFCRSSPSLPIASGKREQL